MAQADPAPWRRLPVRPLLEGDEFEGRRVAGFAWSPPALGVPSSHRDDRLLLDGEETLESPPSRHVPVTSESAVEIAPMPPDDLDDGLRHDADDELAARASALLDLAATPWQPIARTLLVAVHGAGHRLWLAGGAARDLVRGSALSEIKDLDLCGTVPTGRFADLAYQALRGLELSDSRVTVTRDSLVCAVVRRGVRMFEYRGLSRGGFRFQAVGSRLSEDALHRDYTFNTLMYDVLARRVYDPSGQGLDHLLGDKFRFVPLNPGATPLKAATFVLRTMKFALRWRTEQPDLTLALAWMDDLDPDLWSALTPMNWDSLRRRWREIDAPVDRQREFAERLPSAARELLVGMIGGR